MREVNHKIPSIDYVRVLKSIMLLGEVVYAYIPDESKGFSLQFVTCVLAETLHTFLKKIMYKLLSTTNSFRAYFIQHFHCNG